MGTRVTTKEASKLTGISEYSLTCMRKQVNEYSDIPACVNRVL